jgi:hypothetical protein
LTTGIDERNRPAARRGRTGVPSSDDGEHYAWVALWEFEHDGFRFDDWERDCKVWTHRFLWCCHALEWAIDRYDSTKQPAQAAAA